MCWGAGTAEDEQEPPPEKTEEEPLRSSCGRLKHLVPALGDLAIPDPSQQETL